jgi:hypothetical protein
MLPQFRRSDVVIEIILWVAAASVCFFFYYLAWQQKFMYRDVHPSLGFVVAGTAFLLLPVLCKLIFGSLPLEILRLRFTGAPTMLTIPSAGLEVQIEKTDSVTGWIPTTSDALGRLQLLASASKQIAEKLYLPSGVYLLIGVLVAFSGLAFFYYQQSASDSLTARLTAVEVASDQRAQEDSRWFKESMLHTLPRFGILFFIETIAFFFLRQYRRNG